MGAAVALLRAILPVARTWHFRDPVDPSRRPDLHLGSDVFVTWHEHLLPLAWLLRGRTVATLASDDRDGEIVTRILEAWGYGVARGSSTRGGSRGFRELARASAAGRPVVLTADGPRGPRRRLKPGALRLAELAGRPVRAIGAAATAGWRLDSWDRFLIPGPGATVFVSIGDPAETPDGTRAGVDRALARSVRRCEAAAREARWGGALRVRRLEPLTPTASSDPFPGPRRLVEARARAAWSEPRPAGWLRATAAGFTAVAGLRDRAYDLGLFQAHHGGLSVVSVGGATVGGSGKTPIAADVARRLEGTGHRVAILTRGYRDELLLHRRRSPEASAWGHPDRVALARRAAAEGATVAVLDDGFEHRRLARDLDVLVLDRDALRRTNRRRLPAGPFRRDWRDAAARADIVVLTGREPWSDEVERFDAGLRDELVEAGPGATVASLSFECPAPRAGNRAAREVPDPAPRLALTGIMKPDLFFDLARGRCPSLEIELALPDHGAPAADAWPGLAAAAGEGGVLMTEKDLTRLGAGFPPDVPVWYLPERIVWRAGEEAFARHLAAAVPPPPPIPAGDSGAAGGRVGSDRNSA